MANAKTTNKEEDIKVEEKVDENKNKKIEDLESEINKLKEMLTSVIETQKSNNSNNTNDIRVVSPTLKMDKPCTLIHLLECPRDLPTTIKVNNIPKYFTRFGEKHTFRLSDMENITSQYRNWFERGIFTLGDDCEDFKVELGIDCVPNNISVNTYRTMEKLSNAKFEDFIKNINEIQRVHIAQTWVQRFLDKKPGYNDPEKIRILNKYTKDKALFKRGILSDLLKDED